MNIEYIAIGLRSQLPPKKNSMNLLFGANSSSNRITKKFDSHGQSVTRFHLFRFVWTTVYSNTRFTVVSGDEATVAIVAIMNSTSDVIVRVSTQSTHHTHTRVWRFDCNIIINKFLSRATHEENAREMQGERAHTGRARIRGVRDARMCECSANSGDKGEAKKKKINETQRAYHTRCCLDRAKFG